jgi:hypothetical protein
MVTPEALKAIEKIWGKDTYTVLSSDQAGFLISITRDSLNILDQTRGINENYSDAILRVAKSK